MLRIVALGRGCWSVLRDKQPQPEGQEFSSLTNVGSAALDGAGRVEACGSAEVAPFVSHDDGRLAWTDRGPGMLLVADGRTTLIHSTGAGCWTLQLSG